MTQVSYISSSSGSPTTVGKRQIAMSMYNRGKAFVGAAILLRRQGDSEPMDHVVLHLLCQGIEITLKGILLLRDYDRYMPCLRELGHDLARIADETSKAYGLAMPRGAVAAELCELNNLYSQHLTRYASVYDILVDPRTISRQSLLHRIGAVVRLIERELKRG